MLVWVELIVIKSSVGNMVFNIKLGKWDIFIWLNFLLFVKRCSLSDGGKFLLFLFVNFNMVLMILFERCVYVGMWLYI